MNILSIDAWGNNKDGYEWNEWFKIGTISKEDFEKLDSNRKLIKYMRNEGFLSDYSKGKISIEDFIKKEAGSIGVFMVDPCDKNRFQSVIHSYTKNRKNRKTERKINIKFFPIVIDGFEIVKHIHLVEIMK